MRSPSAFNVLNGANWCAVAIAIWHPTPVTIEDSFALYETGQRQHGKDLDGLPFNRGAECRAMHEAGLTWKEIDEALFIKNSNSYMSKCKRRKKKKHG